jgi:hypothetical protein
MAIAAEKQSLKNESYMGNFMKDAVTNKFQETECISQIVPEGRGETSMSFKKRGGFYPPASGMRTA